MLSLKWHLAISFNITKPCNCNDKRNVITLFSPPFDSLSLTRWCKNGYSEARCCKDTGQLEIIGGSCSRIKWGREPQCMVSGHIWAKLHPGKVPGAVRPTALFQADYFGGRIFLKHWRFWFFNKPHSTRSPLNLLAN